MLKMSKHYLSCLRTKAILFIQCLARVFSLCVIYIAYIKSFNSYSNYPRWFTLVVQSQTASIQSLIYLDYVTAFFFFNKMTDLMI